MTIRLKSTFLSSGQLVRIACLVGGGSILAACSSATTTTATTEKLAPKFSEAEYGKSSPRVITDKRKVPDGGGRYMVGKPYRVAGKTYVPQDVSEGFTTTGTASWYGANFHGRKTANGEIYDMGDLSAAHPTLPLPSYVRVTNLDNDRSVVVRVNDRGPFSRNRVLDVSAAAAHMLDFKNAGTAKVKVDYVGPAQMDGKDNQMLVASYRGPGEQAGNTMLASNEPAKPKRTLLAFGGFKNRHAADDNVNVRPTVDFNVADETMAFGATPPPASLDPLAPLILDAGFASSYAAAQPQVLTRAHVAAAAMASAGSTTVPAPVAVTAPKMVQIGTFSDISNAKRVAGTMAAFGEPIVVADSGNGGTVHIVRLRVTSDPKAAIAEAGKLGLPGAFVMRNAN